MPRKSLPLADARNLQTAVELVRALRFMREDYESDGLSPPPLPESVFDLAPCSFNVIETRDGAGRIKGKIVFTSPDGEELFEHEWFVGKY